jgi:AcrR family transcriptional regulator
MPRPVAADGAKTRARILATASMLFSEHGADATSIRDIAAAAKLSVAMVHHYFGNKEALYAATVEAMYEELATVGAELEEAAKAGGALAEHIARAVGVGYRFARAHRPALRFVMRDVLATGEVPRAQKDRFLHPLLQNLEALLGPATAEERRALRLAAQSVVFVLNRYALASEAEIREIAGEPKASSAATTEIIVEHLASLAIGQLIGAHPWSTPSPPTPKTSSKAAPPRSAGASRRSTRGSRSAR